MRLRPHSFLLLLSFTAVLSIGATTPDTAYVINDEFESWEWTPIGHSLQKQGRDRLAAGKDLGYEYRGPLYRKPEGFELPAGRMVEGEAAFDGFSMVLSESQAGLHGRYSRKFRARRNYSYEVALKGTGTFHFRAWVLGQNPANGETKWLGFPDLITIKVSEQWQVYTGPFSLPTYDESTFKIGDVSAAIVIENDDKVYVDNFRVREKTK